MTEDGGHGTTGRDPAQGAARDRVLAGHSLARARTALQTGDYPSCIGWCREALRLAGADAAVLHLMGAAYVRVGEREDGLRLLALAQTLDPRNAALRIDHAIALEAAGHADDAIEQLAEGRALCPDETDLAVRMAEMLSDAGRHQEAVDVLRATAVRSPDDVDILCRLAAELAGELRTEEALAHLLRAKALAPANAIILTNIGVFHQALGELEPAIEHYRRAIALTGGKGLAPLNLATAYLTRLDFQAGFAQLENRLGGTHIRRPPLSAPRWRGEPLDGRRLLVTAEQGYGDMIQFARFLPHLRRFGGDVIVECYAGLERLFATIGGVASCVTVGAPLPEVELTIPLVSLPSVLGSTGKDVAAAAPYIPAPLPRPALDLGEVGPKIGLVWHGKPADGEVYVRRSLNRRSCPLSDLASLLTAGIAARFYSLQMGEAAQELAAARLPLTDATAGIADFADTAAIVAQLDLVITVDTATAHLAGAMGRPVWILLAPGQADYRWGTQGERTPWYPSARLLRADRGGWPRLIERLAAELRRWAARRGAKRAD